MLKTKPNRVASYRVVGTGHDGQPYDLIQAFTQVQAESITLAAVVHDDGVNERIAHALVRHWNEVARLQGVGTVYSVHAAQIN